MLVKKEQWPIAMVLLTALVIFGFIFILKENYEFLIYIGIIFIFGTLIIATNKKIIYPNNLLWGLTIWAILHMAGGGIFIGGKRLYEIILIPLVEEPYNIFKYDQLVHIIGFGVATLLMYYLLLPFLKDKIRKTTALMIVIIMAGLGAGATNEIIEFLATVIAPETGVGGYENTALDLVSNFIGALLASVYIKREISHKHC